MTDKRKGAKKRVSGKLSLKDRENILRIVNEKRFRDLTPHKIVAILLQEGKYIGSEKTIYRVLKENNQIHHRENTRNRKGRKKPPEKKANKSNQVWCWDITWLKTSVKGIFYYLYMIIDIYDRYIVGWSIHKEESEEHSRKLFYSLYKEKNIKFEHVHSDNGKPMRGTTLQAFLLGMNVSTSFNRPRVSNDNPYIESLFRTYKYKVEYPNRFETIEEAKKWTEDFVNWYNTEHLHSGIKYVTPSQMRSGEAFKILKKRKETLTQAKLNNPERWGSRKIKDWECIETVKLNPKAG